MWKRLITVVFLAVVSLALTAFQALEPPETLCDALIMLGTVAGIQIAVGVLISILLEYWPTWGELPPKSKRPIVFALCLVVPVGSLLASVGLCGVVLTLNALYLAMLAGCLAFTTADFTHIRKLPSR